MRCCATWPRSGGTWLSSRPARACPRPQSAAPDRRPAPATMLSRPPTREEARPSRDGPPCWQGQKGYLCFFGLAVLKPGALAMTIEGVVFMQMA